MILKAVILLITTLYCTNNVHGLQCYNCQGKDCHWLTSDMLVHCSMMSTIVAPLRHNVTLFADNDDATAAISDENSAETTTIGANTNAPHDLGSYACYVANFDGELALGCIYVPPDMADCEALQNQYSDIVIDSCATCTFDGCNNVDYVYGFISVVIIIMIVLLIIAIICVIICVCCTGCTICAGCSVFACCHSETKSPNSYNINDCERNEKKEKTEVCS